MPSFTTTYECAACHASSRVEVTGLRDPGEQIAPRTQDAMRKLHELQGKEGDPVADLGLELLAQEARFELQYATCPRCGERNPEGVAKDRAEARRSRVIGLAFFSALAAGAWYVPWIALALPALDLLVLRPMGYVYLRRRGEPARPLLLARAIALDVALIALIALVPRAAPLVPLLGIVMSLVRRPASDDWRWREAAGKMKFEE